MPRVQSGGRTVLAEAFTKAGMKVIEVAAYESSCPEGIPEETAKALSDSKVDAIAFTSAKTVRHTSLLMRTRFGDQWKEKFDKVKILSIGPQTTITCHKFFNKIDGEANPHDLQGLINTCLNLLKD